MNVDDDGPALSSNQTGRINELVQEGLTRDQAFTEVTNNYHLDTQSTLGFLDELLPRFNALQARDFNRSTLYEIVGGLRHAHARIIMNGLTRAEVEHLSQEQAESISSYVHHINQEEDPLINREVLLRFVQIVQEHPEGVQRNARGYGLTDEQADHPDLTEPRLNIIEFFMQVFPDFQANTIFNFFIRYDETQLQEIMQNFHDGLIGEDTPPEQVDEIVENFLQDSFPQLFDDEELPDMILAGDEDDPAE